MIFESIDWHVFWICSEIDLIVNDAESVGRVEELFHAGVDLPPEERELLLELECKTDVELKTELRELFQLRRWRRKSLTTFSSNYFEAIVGYVRNIAASKTLS